MKKQPCSNPSGVGRTSLLVIFAVLCLSMLALLSLNTVLAQKRLSERSLASVSSCYAADLEAQTIFARLRAGEQVSGVQQEGNLFSYACPVSEALTLRVVLEKKPESWVILRWQTEAHPAALEDILPVWTGDEKEETP